MDSNADIKIQDPLVGQDSPVPGYWAMRAQESPWHRGRRTKKTPGTLLNFLVGLPQVREPGIRMIDGKRPPTGEEFDMRMGMKTANQEALNGQCTGVYAETPCTYCQRELGIWSSCVLLSPENRHRLTACMNCHVGSQDSRCSLANEYRQDKDTADAPRRPSTPTVVDDSDLSRELEDRREARAKAQKAIACALAAIQDAQSEIECQTARIEEILDILHRQQ